MASSSTAAPAAPPAAEIIKSLKDQVYDESMRLTQEDSKVVFHQQDIQDFDFMNGVDLHALLTIINELLQEKLYKVVQDGEGMGWRVRNAEDAKRYQGLTSEQEMVYSHIDEADSEGIWIRTVKQRTKLHDSVIGHAIKHLEGRSLVKSMKSVEHPTRKMYIKSTIRASEKATGGAFYGDGELDEEFIAMMMQFLVKYITSRSFYRSSTLLRTAGKNIERTKMTPEEIKAARDKGLGPRGTRPREAEGGSARAEKMRNYESMVPMPHGYQGYPDVHEMTSFIEEKGVSKTTLTSVEIQQLLDVLCYDDIIEKVQGGPQGISYRALRKSLLDSDEAGSVLTEMPCGRCPVFDLCEEGGPVGPSNCVYYNDWLEL
ncbi:putative DNA-directed RNA polymerase III subunit rpc6 [Lachnellula suecica]|uniref:DNA-directed RNA polymerase III subunit RPC6 n=1 Tax=Lachnellula suecica TaxID=602035 RepID=A0A8T9CGJ4_9HELO|nr:putative DNA-directed RNA polymerase III subunit rpc6 [Lachnellula suecica]